MAHNRVGGVDVKPWISNVYRGDTSSPCDAKVKRASNLPQTTSHTHTIPNRGTKVTTFSECTRGAHGGTRARGGGGSHSKTKDLHNSFKNFVLHKTVATAKIFHWCSGVNRDT